MTRYEKKFWLKKLAVSWKTEKQNTPTKPLINVDKIKYYLKSIISCVKICLSTKLATLPRVLEEVQQYA
jgi:hypothetical protein